jgi:DNA-binding NarL/FixJ family response regulator
MAKVLILDDHTLVAELLREELAADGHQVLTSSDPRQVISTILLFAPDILIMDPFLGKRPRWDLLRRIKRSHEGIPVIVYTGHQDYEQDPHLEMARAFVLKRSSLEEIKALVGEVASGKQVQVPLGKRSMDSSSKEAQPSPSRNRAVN